MTKRKGWKQIRCSMCGGHGMYSRYSHGDFEGAEECGDCGGSGKIWQHLKSKVLAAWPGGKLLGRAA